MNVSPQEFESLYNIMQVCRMPSSDLNPPTPYHMAIYDDEAITKFQIPISSGILTYQNKTYRVNYLQKNRYRLEIVI